MDPVHLVPLALGVALGGFASWNNASISVGILMGAGVFKRRVATLLVSISVFVGIALEGYHMARSAQSLVEVRGDPAVVFGVVILSILLVLIYLTYIGIPTSLTQMSIMSIVAIGILANTRLNLGYLETIVATWVATPIVSMLMSALIYRAIESRLAKMRLNWIRVLGYLRPLLLVSSLYLAYVIGANLLGFLYSLISPIYSATSIHMMLYGVVGALGVALSNEVMAVNVGFRTTRLGVLATLITLFSGSLIVHVSTWLQLPVSITQCVMGGAFGISLAKGSLRMGAPRKMVKNWLLAPLFTFVLTLILYRLVA